MAVGAKMCTPTLHPILIHARTYARTHLHIVLHIIDVSSSIYVFFLSFVPSWILHQHYTTNRILPTLYCLLFYSTNLLERVEYRFR